MADPRFYDNRGPFTLGAVCEQGAIAVPQGANTAAQIFDVAGLREAGPPHLSFFDSPRAAAAYRTTQAGWCLTGAKAPDAPKTVTRIVCASPARAFAGVARLFYPENELDIRIQDKAIHPSAKIGQGVAIGPGAVIGPGAELGDGSRIGANAVIGRGVAVGRGCEIGPNAYVAFAHIGDGVVIQPGVVIGGSGFGFSAGADGYLKLPQLGRVIVQDKVEIGANSTIDRGALGATVIGEGTKIDNLIQIGHNTRMGRHCIVVSKSGISGSVIIGDRVILGAMAGVADHVTIGDGAQLAAMSGVTHDLEGGRAYGGFPARPIGEWRRERVTLARLLARENKRTKDE
jgi:UDP-3-O-[3-hydroxymyristoyl] glucosamine N-acyltransferase